MVYTEKISGLMWFTINARRSQQMDQWAFMISNMINNVSTCPGQVLFRCHAEKYIWTEKCCASRYMLSVYQRPTAMHCSNRLALSPTSSHLYYCVCQMAGMLLPIVRLPPSGHCPHWFLHLHLMVSKENGIFYGIGIIDTHCCSLVQLTQCFFVLSLSMAL